MIIPKTIHITWKDNNLTEKQKLILGRWKLLHPDFNIKFYTDDDNDKFINLYFPEYREILDKLKRKVCKIDFIRLLYLYQFGGIYVDLDVIPLKKIDSLLNINDVVLCKEDSRNAPYFKIDYIISNATILAKKNSEFIKKIIDDIIFNIDSPKMNSTDTDDVLKMTGPLLFNKIYDQWESKNNITLLESRFFNPMTLYDLTKEIIPDYIKYSFCVHLFDGTWWQKKYNSSIDLIQKIILKHDTKVILLNENIEESVVNYKKTQEAGFPLISCLCITKNNYDLVSLSIDCFKKQIYPNKELIVVYEDNNDHIDKIIQEYSESNIKYIKIKSNPKKTLGELRNISIEVSKGTYICQWDDDDWYSPLRLWEQFYHMKSQNKEGSILKKWLVYDNVKNILQVSKRLSLAGWEGSVLYKKSKIKNLYELLSKGEDTGFIEKIQTELAVIDHPELYIYRIHSCNTWDYEKMTRDIVNYSAPHENQLYIYNIFNKSCLKTINNQYCEVLLNNSPYSESYLNKISEKKFDTGVVISSFGRYEDVKRMLSSLSNSNLEDNVLLIFVDETNSINSPKPKYWSEKTEELIRDFSLKNINIIKLFKKYHGNMFDSIRVGFDVLTTDFQCEKLMILDSDTIMKKDWYLSITKNNIFEKIKNFDYIISGFNKDELDEETRKLNSFNQDYYKNKYIGGINMFFKKELYYKTRHLYKDKFFDHHISKFLFDNNGLLLSLKKSAIDHIGKLGDNSNNELFFDVASDFYYNPNELDYIFNESIEKDEVPKVIHRVLLYDDEFPKETLKYLKRFKKYNSNFYHILWRESDVLNLMNDSELKTYNAYNKKIQKSDYARYIILKYYGGIYCDIDIDVKFPFDILYDKFKSNDLFFEETTLTDKFKEETKSYKIRNGESECCLRIANYIIMTKPNSKNIQGVLDLCEQRKELEIKDDYDIIYTTGPDIISTYFNQNKSNLHYLSKKNADLFFNHQCIGHWRENKYENNNIKISVIMQSYLGNYNGSRKNSKNKFIRAVNSFINQNNKNNELIIVSDGCKITFDLYHTNFKNENRIKFIYINKDDNTMYDKIDGKTFFRGKPREIGRGMATGDVITYMDSDDFILPNYLEELNSVWNNNKDLDWIINKSWYDNETIIQNQTPGYYNAYETLDDKNKIKINGLDGMWIASMVKDKIFVNSPALFSHKNYCDVKWEDSYNVSEDHVFMRKVKEKYTKNGYIKILGYVRCHLKEYWDL